MIRKGMHSPEEFHGIRDQWRQSISSITKYIPLKEEEDGGLTGQTSQRTSEDLQMDDPMLSSQTLLLAPAKLMPTSADDNEPLSLQATARLSLEFCILWFVANYFVSACLQYTTVASSTILTSTSSVFTLAFGSLFGVEKFTIRKLLGILASLAGIALISSMDFSSGNNDEHRGDFPRKTRADLILGDSLAFCSAVLYGLYAVFMKKRIADESRVDMPVFFGLVGLINVVLLWPGFLILHFTGAEVFELPPTGKVVLIILVSSHAVHSCIARFPSSGFLY